MEQLQAHNGLVRCGSCDHVFNADQQLFDDIPQKPAPKPTTVRKKTGGANHKPKSTKVKPLTAGDASSRKPSRTGRKAPEKPVETATTPRTAKPDRAKPRLDSVSTYDVAESELEQLLQRPQPRRFSFWWIPGILLLAVTLAAQSAYFYRDQLAAYAEWRPYLVDACERLGCSLQPPYDVSRIELIQPTNIAPHPRFANALRLRATLVNRANKPQPHPLMQVTLTDSAGHILSRRTFTPSQYLEHRTTAGTDMPPNLAIGALLDLTNADSKAVGYQIDFFAPRLNAPKTP